MSYPFWDVDIGYGLIMAFIAVIHVFISHFAIGGGLYLVVAEMSARKKQDNLRLDFLQKLSKFFVLVSVVSGALTGVGIWFIIGLLNPAATEALIHNFVWGWAIEWTFFLIEICSAILYFYSWNKISSKNHIIIGWIYFISAWLSLFIINGIITFMLTPGDWLATGNFWDGFFNPTYWSSLVLRTGICIMLAGVYAMVIAARYKADDFKASLVKYNAVWGLAGLIITVLSFMWYIKDIPGPIMQNAREMMRTPMVSIEESYLYAAGVGLLLILFGFILPKKQNLVIAILTMTLALGWFGSYEWFRESIRKPYVITDYMYGNGIDMAKITQYESEGYLVNIRYRTGNDGLDLFNHACRSCHTINGYKPLRPTFDGTDEEFIAGIIRGIHVMKGNMPELKMPFDEIQMIAKYIYSQVDHRSIDETSHLQGIKLGKRIYEIRCGKCHEIGGYNDKFESLVGLSEEDYNDFLDNAADFADEMPPFTGNLTERKALVEFFLSLKEGGVK